MENMSKIIGSNIRKYRTLKKMTREQLAEAVDLDSAYLGQCERGERQLGLTKTIQIIEFFGVTANDIIAVSNKKAEYKKKSIFLRSMSCCRTAQITRRLPSCGSSRMHSRS